MRRLNRESAPRWSFVARMSAALQNAVELARFGKPGPPARTPYDVVFHDDLFKLRRYREDGGPAGRRPAIVLVPPLMLHADVYDISVEGSAVAVLLDRGIDPWVVDFGAPERQKGGLRRTLADHVLAVSRAVEHTADEVGKPVHLAGYSQGGMFCYQTAAYRRSARIASIVTFGSPVDIYRELIPGLPEEAIARLLAAVGPYLALPFAEWALPPWLSRTVFRLLSPVKEIQNQIEFLTRLHDRETISRREGQRRFLAGEGWVAWPGPALRDFVEQFLVQNRLFAGGFVIEGRTLTLLDITCPVLAFVGEADEIGRPGAVRSIREAAPRAKVYEVALDAGHFGLVVGSKAMRETWPIVAGWLKWQEGIGRRPPRVRLAPRTPTYEERHILPGLAELGREVLALAGETAGERLGTLRSVASNVLNQVPRLARLEGVRRNTRISLGLALAEQAARAPERTFFLYEGRAYTYAEADRRVDAVVRGLLSVGVRQGDHVGILMRHRPSALALVAAVSRLGAVAVLLRPDGDLTVEAGLGEVDHLIADPENAERARDQLQRSVLVLGGGGGAPRTLARDLVDMEAIDPEKVAVPGWYVPNAARAEDVAFMLFSGRGDRVRASRITNRRWALSALGTASAAALTVSDTIYGRTPIQHPTGLLVSLGAALTGGARLALPHGLSAARFWEEVRRYGATVAFYTGTMCRELVDAPPDPAERGHPVRLFAGSGMPRPLWRRLIERFAPAGVLEFYASTEGNAILANVSGVKIGSLGRPLPGSAELAIAAYDARRGDLVRDDSGFCRRVEPGETGLLLSRVERERGALERRPLRGVFAKDDAWHASADLFRCDEDGDYWLVDHVADLIHHRDGPLPSIPIEEAVWEVPGVSAAAAYGVRIAGLDFEIPVVAVMLRAGAHLDPKVLTTTVDAALEPPSRPLVVHVVDALPMTAGYRPLKHLLRAAGLDPRALGKPAFWFDETARTYRPVNTAALGELRRGLGRGARQGRRTSSGAASRKRRNGSTGRRRREIGHE
jgi:putative long chain acyl-CoA synthase